MLVSLTWDCRMILVICFCDVRQYWASTPPAISVFHEGAALLEELTPPLPPIMKVVERFRGNYRCLKAAKAWHGCPGEKAQAYPSHALAVPQAVHQCEQVAHSVFQSQSPVLPGGCTKRAAGWAGRGVPRDGG